MIPTDSNGTALSPNLKVSKIVRKSTSNSKGACRERGHKKVSCLNRWPDARAFFGKPCLSFSENSCEQRPAEWVDPQLYCYAWLASTALAALRTLWKFYKWRLATQITSCLLRAAPRAEPAISAQIWGSEKNQLWFSSLEATVEEEI